MAYGCLWMFMVDNGRDITIYIFRKTLRSQQKHDMVPYNLDEFDHDLTL